MMTQRRLLVLALALLFTAGLLGAALAQTPVNRKPPGKTPRAVVPDLSVQAGTLLEGQDYRHSFIVKNTGAAELQILSVRPG
jgi:hypothetical protein